MDEGEESEEEGEGSDKPDPVAWSMPDGFTLGAELVRSPPSSTPRSWASRSTRPHTCARAASAAHGHFPDRSGGGWAGPRVTWPGSQDSLPRGGAGAAMRSIS